MTTIDIDALIRTADLSCEIDRLMLADVMYDAGHDDEARLCRDLTLPVMMRYRIVVRIDRFTQSYIDTAFDILNSRTHCWHSDALEAAARDCHRFQVENADALAAFPEGSDQAGHLFWNYEGDAAARLNAAAMAYRETDAYVGDDGLLHLS